MKKISSVSTDLDLEWECVSDGADVVVVGEKDAVVADDHAVRVDVLLRPARRPEKRIIKVIVSFIKKEMYY